MGQVSISQRTNRSGLFGRSGRGPAFYKESGPMVSRRWLRSAFIPHNENSSNKTRCFKVDARESGKMDSTCTIFWNFHPYPKPNRPTCHVGTIVLELGWYPNRSAIRRSFWRRSHSFQTCSSVRARKTLGKKKAANTL